MRGRRFAVATGAALLATVVALSSEARADVSRDEVLASEKVKYLARIGVMVVGAGASQREASAARELARKTFEAAGHQVVALRGSPSDPPRQSLLAHCVARGLDAVALVRISPASRGWTVEVDVREPEGATVVLRGERSESDALLGGGVGGVAVYAKFSLQMADTDVASLAQQDAAAAQANVDGGADAPPRLWVSERMTMFGAARIDGAEFYRVVGRSDLESRYKRTTVLVTTTRVLGYASLGLGTTTLFLAAMAAGFAEGACSGPNFWDDVTGQQQSCDSNVSSLWLVPVAFTAGGLTLLLAASAVDRNPISLDERRALARDYNTRMQSDGGVPASAAPNAPRKVRFAVSGAPSLRGDGGMLVVGGRF
jgi:hypothetical protein